MELNATHGKKYRVGNIRDLPGYDTTTGVSCDWALGVAGIPYAYSIELRPVDFCTGFILPANQIIPTGGEIMAFHVSAAQQIIKEFTP